MGLIGEFLDNTIKLFTGCFSYIIYIMLLSIPILIIFKKKIMFTPISIALIFIVDILLEIIFVKHSNYEFFTYKNINNDNFNFWGGGLIAKYPTKIIIQLLSYYGALIIFISLVLVILLVLFNKHYPNQFEYIKNKFNSSGITVKKIKDVKEKQNNNFKEKLQEVENTYSEDILIDIDNNNNNFNILENDKDNSNNDIVSDYQDIKSYDNYILPPLSLLRDPIENKKISNKEIMDKCKIVEGTFKDFGIDVKIKKAKVGPSIIQFQISPTPGTKVSKIVNLSNDIALNLAAKDIRIEAPIPGTSFIGIEIPNNSTQLVTIKEVFINNEDNSPLSVVLGKDVSGDSIFARLDKMPHLLVAGSTGSGKSVCINTIITSLLLKNNPDKVKLIMIDPKMVELSIYDGIPHLLTPVVTDPIKAADVLHKVVLEMEKRYREFSIARVKNIESYNKLASKDEEYKEFPYIVVIIDELADLMMVASKEVEESIARISQMARAAGIHLIIATQRPSVDVITGVIKTNIPSRIAFAVSSSVDSRTILDQTGAEKLLGRGDMLFQSIDASKPIRVQGAFLSDQEVENIVDFIKNQAETQYDPNMQPSDNISRDSSNNSEEVDPLYKEVLLFIAKTQKASASLLQRRFKIGYNRAARIVEMLEEDGYIGPAEGSKPRKVFLEPEFAENNE
ncbi:DNA translocase FtsK [Gemella sp. GH3]|nr:DNA translocase FtsK [Gemella sp. GH3.1]NYS50138.1 DNA translocase FtsK [Gemella sp. GH3]